MIFGETDKRIHEIHAHFASRSPLGFYPISALLGHRTFSTCFRRWPSCANFWWILGRALGFHSFKVGMIIADICGLLNQEAQMKTNLQKLDILSKYERDRAALANRQAADFDSLSLGGARRLRITHMSQVLALQEQLFRDLAV